MAKNKILLIDDEPSIRFGIRDFLESNDYEVFEADSFHTAQEIFRVAKPDLAILDYALPDGNALDLLPRLKAIDPGIPLLVLTAHGSIDLAVKAVKEGAEQFLTKPVQLPSLLVIIERLLENQRNRRNQVAGKKREARSGADPFLGNSPAIRRLEEQVRKIVASDSPIMIQGDTGSGKGILANWIHANSPRADEAFVDLNCAGLSREFLESELFGHEKGAFTGATNMKPGLLEVAHRGTVFLDEIGDVDIQVQPKLLKVLEDKKFRRLGDVRDRRVDIRLVAATHQDLAMLVREKKFRSDLFFRINTIPLAVPPLRDRGEDIIVIARHLLERLALDIGKPELSLTEDAEKALCDYDWPGNIRELRNVLERAVLLSEKGTITRRDFQFGTPSGAGNLSGDIDLTLDELERKHIERVLLLENGKVEQAAKRLGVPRSSLYQKLKKYQIAVSKI